MYYQLARKLKFLAGHYSFVHKWYSIILLINNQVQALPVCAWAGASIAFHDDVTLAIVNMDARKPWKSPDVQLAGQTVRPALSHVAQRSTNTPALQLLGPSIWSECSNALPATSGSCTVSFA